VFFQSQKMTSILCEDMVFLHHPDGSIMTALGGSESMSLDVPTLIGLAKKTTLRQSIEDMRVDIEKCL
jgi:hypothetical protein